MKRFAALLTGTGLCVFACRDFAEQNGSGGASSGKAGAAALAGGGADGDTPNGGAGGDKAGNAGAPTRNDGGATRLGGSQAGEAPGGSDPGGQTSGGQATWFGTDEPSPIASCDLAQLLTPTAAAEFAISGNAYGGLQAYSWDPTTSTSLVRYANPGDAWTKWLCFELLPNVKRLAATDLPNTHNEVFAIAQDNTLFVRREKSYWTSWLPFSLPTDADLLSDVATTSGARPRVYVIADGRTFVRTKVADGAYADYGPWRGLKPNDAMLVSAVPRGTTGQLVITANESGIVQTAYQASPDDEFTNWTELSAVEAPVIDLDAVASDESEVAIYALDATSRLWKTRFPADDMAWTLATDVSDAPAVVAIGLRAAAGGPRIFGIDSAANLHELDASSREWRLLATP